MVRDVSKHLNAGAAATLSSGEVRVVSLPKPPRRDGERARPNYFRTAIVLRDHDGHIRAYVNECRHIPVPLGPRDYFDDGKRHLMCRTHGAIFELADGYCVAGPCKGDRLIPIPFFVRDGIVTLDLTQALPL